jgi:hypothetical protein
MASQRQALKKLKKRIEDFTKKFRAFIGMKIIEATSPPSQSPIAILLQKIKLMNLQ